MSETNDTRTSRPLRALAVMLVAYAGARTAVLWQPDGVVPETSLRSRVPTIEVPPIAQFDIGPRRLVPPPAPLPVAKPVASPRPGHPFPAVALVVRQAVGLSPGIGVVEQATPMPGPAPTSLDISPTTDPAPLLAPPTSRERWSGSFYAVTRGAGGVGTAPLLGGTQAGFRAYRMVGRTFAATASFAASPGDGGTREATIGVALRGRNAGLIAERSVRIGSGGASGFRLFGYAGVTEVLPARFRIEGYGQAGVSSGQAFADGALALERPLLEQGDVEISAGASSWASIQRGARRIDVGPQLVARIPVAGQRIRVSAEWRMRIAGNAAPGSGPSVTVGADF